jgi:hypothetical protein
MEDERRTMRMTDETLRVTVRSPAGTDRATD